MNHTKQNFGKIPYRDIKVTLHAKQRAYERLGITRESEIQKLAHAAKYNGVKIKALNPQNYSSVGLSYNMYRYLKNHYSHQFKTEKTYYYKDYVYIFAGDRSRCLKSIVPCTAQDAALAISKMDKIPVEQVVV